MKRGMSACERIAAAADVIFVVVLVFLLTMSLLLFGVDVVATAVDAAAGRDVTAGSGDKNGRGSCNLIVILWGGGSKRERDFNGEAATLNTF